MEKAWRHTHVEVLGLLFCEVCTVYRAVNETEQQRQLLIVC